jgi:hypothetical protein
VAELDRELPLQPWHILVKTLGADRETGVKSPVSGENDIGYQRLAFALDRQLDSGDGQAFKQAGGFLLDDLSSCLVGDGYVG